MITSGRVNFHPEVGSLLISIDQITPHPANPRNGDVDAVVKSIIANGFIAPIVAQRSTGHILAGNHRYFALCQLGSKVAPVIWVDVDDHEAVRYLLDDNHTADKAMYDNAQLVELLDQLAEVDLLDTSSYDEHERDLIRTLTEMGPNYGDHASWPTLTLTVPPHLKNAFYEYTDHCHTDAERIEALLRMAGWEP